MQKFTNAVTRFISDDEGAALAEYGILIAFIAALRQTAAEREPWPQAAPPAAAVDGYPVCCDNFA